ncbi:hypothetical protein CYY_000993 [Polysphondylium violaceum]|uniref:Chromatin-remodeling ATPase INO80 n=1 Tax=Polysphondylium violaceum TaxID=133409 RepID=A0A8J4Q2P7_9MYCE|nr:hypothetical protein CYY_000993 [Polysphondylium violaceum]
MYSPRSASSSPSSRYSSYSSSRGRSSSRSRSFSPLGTIDYISLPASSQKSMAYPPPNYHSNNSSNSNSNNSINPPSVVQTSTYPPSSSSSSSKYRSKSPSHRNSSSSKTSSSSKSTSNSGGGGSSRSSSSRYSSSSSSSKYGSSSKSTSTSSSSRSIGLSSSASAIPNSTSSKDKHSSSSSSTSLSASTNSSALLGLAKSSTTPRHSPSLRSSTSSTNLLNSVSGINSSNSKSNALKFKKISRKDKEKILELLNEHESDNDFDFSLSNSTKPSPVLKSTNYHSSSSSTSSSTSSLPSSSSILTSLQPLLNTDNTPPSVLNNNNSKNSNHTSSMSKSNINSLINNENINVGKENNNNNSSSNVSTYQNESRVPMDISKTNDTNNHHNSHSISIGNSNNQNNESSFSDPDITEDYYFKMLHEYKKDKSKKKKSISDKYFKDIKLSDDDDNFIFNERTDRKQLKLMKKLLDNENMRDRERYKVMKKKEKKKIPLSKSSKYIKDRIKSSRSKSSSSSSSTHLYSKKKAYSDDDDSSSGDDLQALKEHLSNNPITSEDEDHYDILYNKSYKKKKKYSSSSSASAGTLTNLSGSTSGVNYSSSSSNNTTAFLATRYPEVDQDFHSKWATLIRKELPRQYKKYQDNHTNGLANNKKIGSMMSREIKKRYKAGIPQPKPVKDIQNRSRRLVKEMGAYWRKFDKDEREAKKRAEKEETNQRKREEEIQEAKRQQRKLNFLITQTELYSHFMGKKLTDETGGPSAPSTSAISAQIDASNSKKITEAATGDGQQPQQVEEYEDESDDELNEQDKQEVEKLKNEAILKTQKAIEQQITKTQNFDKDVDKIRNSNPETMAEEKNANNLATDVLMDGNNNSNANINGSNIPFGFGIDSLSQPSILNAELKPYQLKGMSWIVNLYDQGINGILADEMGLGKTIQSIAVLAHLAEEKNIWGPFLIVTPKSTLHNWKNEFAKFVPSFKVLPYWGNQKQRQTIRKFWNPKKLYNRNSPFHVLITSYNVIVLDEKYFHRIRWQYMVLDEAHAIKSSASNRWKTLMSFNCRNRLLLTGTPIQNSMAELWALLHFIMPTLFDSHEEFAEWFSKDIENHAMSQGGLNEHQLNRLHMILKPFMLRRIKKDVENEMPPKYEVEVNCSLTVRQKKLYQGIKSKISISEILGNNSFSEASMKNLMNLVMQFRKVCNHPETFERSECKSPLLFQTAEEAVNVTLPLSTTYLKTVKAVVNNPITFSIPKLVYRNCWFIQNQSDSNINDQLKQCTINRFSIFSPSTSNDNNSITSISNLIGLSPQELFNLKNNFSILDMYITNQTLEKEVYPVLDYIYSDKDSGLSNTIKYLLLEPTFTCKLSPHRLKSNYQQLVISPSDRCQWNQVLIRSVFSLYPKCTAPPIDIVCSDQSFARDKAAQFLNDPEVQIPLTNLVFNGMTNNIDIDQKQFEFNQLDLPANLYHNTLDQFVDNAGLVGELNGIFGSSSIWVPSFSKSLNDSGKLQVLDSMLKRLKPQGHRVLVYSQFTKMMNILEDFMIYRKYKYRRLDGSSKLEDRRDLVDDYQTDNSIFVFLLSTRACGMGINLTAADTVIFYDSDWNPTADEQAMDRCHRLGQQRPVTVYRLITKGTIEEKILKRAKQKHQIQSIVIAGGKFEIDNLSTGDDINEREVVSFLLDDDEVEEKFKNQFDPITGKKRKEPESSETSVQDKPFSPSDIPTTYISKGRPPKEKEPTPVTAPKRKGPKPGFKRNKVDPTLATTPPTISNTSPKNEGDPEMPSLPKPKKPPGKPRGKKAAAQIKLQEQQQQLQQ